METGFVALGIVVLLGAVYLAWQRSRDRLYFPGGTVPLERNELYEFVYIASFSTEQAAESCRTRTETLGLTLKLFPPSDYQRIWSLHWWFVSKPNGKKVRALERQLKAAVAESGGRYSDLAVSKPGAMMVVGADENAR
jgi:hypothetical protein